MNTTRQYGILWAALVFLLVSGAGFAVPTLPPDLPKNPGDAAIRKALAVNAKPGEVYMWAEGDGLHYCIIEAGAAREITKAAAHRAYVEDDSYYSEAVGV